MIEFTRAYVANGKTYATLEEAQEAEILKLLTDGQKSDGETAVFPNALAHEIVKNGAKIVSILTTNSKSRPRARKENGGRKQRKAAPATEPALEI